MISQSGERSFLVALIPAGCSTIDSVFTAAFKHTPQLVQFNALAASIVGDFWVKSAGKGSVRSAEMQQMPCPAGLEEPLAARVLALNCLTVYYSDLWAISFRAGFQEERWATADPRLDDLFFVNLTRTWRRECALRSHYCRREALVEIDVLAARVLQLSLKELQTIFAIQFPVARQYERDTWYDAGGRIVFAVSMGLPGVGLPRRSNDSPCWEDVKNMQSGRVEQVVMDDTLPGGPRKKTIVYHAPFDRCDRERDYEVVWAEFEKRYGKVRTKK
jgi:hypothetical protein